MKSKYIMAKIDSMAKSPGVVGCAVVETHTGMVWHASGSLANLIPLTESTTDYWRLYQRNKSTFDIFGPLDYLELALHDHAIRLHACGNDMMFTTLCLRQNSIDWDQWTQRIRQLSHILDSR